MTEPRYRAAIIGAGRMGGLLEDEQPPNTFRKPHGHFAAYSAVDETEVVAVAGRRPGRLKLFTERFGMTNTYLDYREMIEKEKPEIVSVTTQSRYRAEAILFAVEHGVRGIYAEKALCASLAEADAIAAACRSKGWPSISGPSAATTTGSCVCAGPSRPATSARHSSPSPSGAPIS